MLHTYCDVVEQITVRLAPYVAIATTPSVKPMPFIQVI
jgi:hypothetical protein